MFQTPKAMPLSQCFHSGPLIELLLSLPERNRLKKQNMDYNADIEDKIYAERTKLLFENARVSNVIVLIASTILALILWNQVPTLHLITWYGYMLLIAGFRFGLAIKRQYAPATETDAPIWVRRFIIATTFLGIGWAIIILLGFSSGTWNRMLMILLVVAILSVSIPVLVSFPRVVHFYSIPPVATLIGLLFIQGGNDSLLGIAVAFYALLMYRSSGNLNQTLTESMRLRFQNQQLAGRLSSQKDKAELLNEALQAEVAERKQAQLELDDHRLNLETQIMDRTRELVKAKEAAEAASKAKSLFLATMSHEIRTPINGVLGMTELLLSSGLNDKQKQLAETAHHSGIGLLDVINNILDFSKIEAGRLEIVQAPFNLDELVEDVVQMLSEVARDKHLELFCDLPSETAHQVIGDITRVRQILINLVGNALKFTQQGEVVVRVITLEDTQDDTLLKFEVQDSGIGIKPESMANVFEAFSQEDGSTTRKFGGTGLGLTITRQLVSLMGGESGVVSVPGEGSIFWFTCRFGKQPSTNAIEWQEASRLQDVRVLLVDDNANISSLLKRKLNQWGLRAACAGNAEQALKMLHAAVLEGAPYQLAILDKVMPIMDGISLAHVIKSNEEIAATRLMMFTATHEKENDTSWREAGIEAYLTKPARLKQLHDKLTQLLDHPPPGNPPDVLPMAESPTPANQSQIGGHILVVEDNPVNQAVALGMLEQLGCRVDILEDGKDALQAVSRQAYDLLFMDCYMPEMDGFEATRKIREREPDNRRLPIIALTADVQKGVREQCRAAGMDDYLSKPFEQNDLRDKLEKWLPEQKLAYSLSPPEESQQEASATNVLDQRTLEKIRALQRIGKPNILGRVISIYQENTPKLFETIREAVNSGEAETLRQSAHSLKSSSANLGALRLASICKELESMGRENHLQQATGLLEKMTTELDQVMKALRREQETISQG